MSKSFGAEIILENISLEVKSKDRIAIVGRNGSGKSTLLKIMSSTLAYDSGELMQPNNVRIGFLPQHTGLESTKTIWDEMLEVFSDLLQQRKEIEALAIQMASTLDTNTPEYKKLLSSYDVKQHTFEINGGYQYESEIKTVLSGLQFFEEDYKTPINELSGGQKTRLALGKLLLSQPDLLILDEPTNHLDIETMTWLEKYLITYPGAIVIVSHDRYFLDQTVSIVYEISRNHITKYAGTYSYFLEQRAIKYEKEWKAYEKQQSEIKNIETFIQKNIVRASTTKRAQSRRKQLEKMEKINRPLRNEASAKFSFQINRQSGNEVLKVNDFSFRYEGEDEPVFNHVQFQIERGDRIALVGENGVGKTTLLKAILNHQQYNDSIQIGTNVEIGYYDQEQANLSSTKTILSELWDAFPMTNEKDIRTVLGNFLFSGDDVLKEVHTLSGGEKARLALAKLMMKRANFLILDEPTNHLDIDSKEVLEAALLDYPGTILFVSHDRYFINKITHQVVELRKNKATVYLGDYDYYMEKKLEEKERQEIHSPEPPEQQKEQTTDRKVQFERNKEIQREQRKLKRRIYELEEQIDKLEKEIEILEKQLTEPEVFQDHEKAQQITEALDRLKNDLNQCMDEWVNLQEQVT